MNDFKDKVFSVFVIVFIAGVLIDAIVTNETYLIGFSTVSLAISTPLSYSIYTRKPLPFIG